MFCDWPPQSGFVPRNEMRSRTFTAQLHHETRAEERGLRMLDRVFSEHRPLEAFLRKLSHLRPLAHGDILALATLSGRRRVYSPGEIVVAPGSRLNRRTVILSGWVTRAIHLAEGSRQIIGFGLPGDFVAGHGGQRHFAFYTAHAVLETETLDFDPAALDRISADHPAIAEAFDWTTDRDFSGLARTVERIGRRPARTRIAHLLVELSFRLELAGHETPTVLPLRQQDVADACGLSLVHVNKTLRRYQREGLLTTYRRGFVELTDIEGLSHLASYSREAFLQID